MEKVGLFHFVAEPYLMDFRGRVTLPMIGNYLIHAASSHAGERGFGGYADDDSGIGHYHAGETECEDYHS